MKQTGGRLLWLNFKNVRGAKMKCTMSAHFMKNVNEHLCHRGLTFYINASAFVDVRVKALFV